jgi:hypothetical protein
MSAADQESPFIHPGRRIAIAAVERELAEMAAANEAVSAGLRMRSARGAGPSIAYSVRLDRGEVEALERRAAAYGLKPTVLARNLIRAGLVPGGAADLAAAVDRVAEALEELRTLLYP